MKNQRLWKGYRWIILLSLFLFFLGCRSTPPKPETEPSPTPAAPSGPSEPASPSKPSVPPPRSGPSPQEPVPSPSAQPPKEETYFTHIVKWSGETVSIIAAWYTGDIENWKILGEVMLKHHPNADIKRIYVGNKILIPESLLKTREPMPKDFVDSFYKKSKPDKGPSKPTPSEPDEEPKLFGPKESPKK